MSKVCPKCGAEVPEDSLFCQKCGARVSVPVGAGSSNESQGVWFFNYIKSLNRPVFICAGLVFVLSLVCLVLGLTIPSYYYDFEKDAYLPFFQAIPAHYLFPYTGPNYFCSFVTSLIVVVVGTIVLVLSMLKKEGRVIFPSVALLGLAANLALDISLAASMRIHGHFSVNLFIIMIVGFSATPIWLFLFLKPFLPIARNKELPHRSRFLGPALSLLLSVAVVSGALILTVPSFNSSATDSNITYRLNADQKSYELTRVEAYLVKPKSLTFNIPSKYDGLPVTSIGPYAFYECHGLTSVTIPDSVTSIGDYAFSAYDDWLPLSSIVIPSSVTSIGDHAFSGCRSLSSIAIPTSVTSIGSGAFSRCPSLAIFCEREYKPRDWKEDWAGGRPVVWGYRSSYETDLFEYSIGEVGGESYALITGFVGNPVDVVIPSTLRGMPTRFSACSLVDLRESLETIRIQDGVDVLGNLSFSNFRSLKAVALPNTLDAIGDGAFSYCSSLVSITIPDSVTYIGPAAFEECSSLSSIVIPSSVTSIGDHAFFGCSSLASVTISDGVASIGDHAFSGCSSLSSIAIPASVTSIGAGAFEECSSLASVTISDGVASIGDWAFYNCSPLASIVIPSSVASIGDHAFSGCSSLSSVTISDGVASIGDYAFSGCFSLSSIAIPASVTSIGAGAFYDCSSLTIYCEADSKPEGWDVAWNRSECPVVWGYVG